MTTHNDRGGIATFVLIVLAAIIVFGLATVTGVVHQIATWTAHHTQTAPRLPLKRNR